MKTFKLSLILFMVLCLALIVNTPVASSKSITLKLGTVQKPGHHQTDGAYKFAELVKKKTNGEIEIKIFHSQQLGKGPEMVEAVKMGTLDMYVGSAGFYGPYESDYFFLSLGFLFPDYGTVAKVMTSPVGEQMAKRILENHGMRILAQNWVKTARCLLTKVPVSELKDLQNLKLRVPEISSFVETWRGLGAVTTVVDRGEMFTAVSQGIVMGTENPPDVYLAMALYEVAKNMLKTNHIIEAVCLSINDKKLQKIPERFHEILVTSASEAGTYQNKLVIEREAKNFEKLKSKGVTIRDLQGAKRTEFVKKLEDYGLYNKFAEKYKTSPKLYEKIKKIIEN